MILQLAPIDLSRHFDLCVRFRRETQIISFGNDERFRRFLPEYRGWLARRLMRHPESCVHAWIGGEIVGQVEMGLDELHPSSWYVNLLYLVPELRGLRLADQLIAYADRERRRFGCDRLRLTVSDGNVAAIACYERNGFVDLRPRPDHEHLRLMERIA